MPASGETVDKGNGKDFRANKGATGLVDHTPQTESTRPAHLGFMGLRPTANGTVDVGFLNGSTHLIPGASRSTSELVKGLRPFFPENSDKGPKPRIVAAGLPHGETGLGWELWKNHAISPVYLKDLEGKLDPVTAAKIVSERFHLDNGRAKSRQDEMGRVHPDLLVPLEAYAESDPKDVAMAKFFAERIEKRGNERGKKVKGRGVSATEFGGGVAKKWHRVTSVLEQLDVDYGWFIQDSSDPSRYDITKEDIHNDLQLVGEPGRGLTKAKVARLKEWGDKDWGRWEDELMDSDIVLIHDPQPVAAGVIKHIREKEQQNREQGVEDKHRFIIYRSHTQPDAEAANTPGTSQHQTWNLLMENGIAEADYIIAHPLLDSVPANVPPEKVGFSGATEDRFDGLNIQLPEEIMQAAMDIVDDTLQTQVVVLKDKDGKPLREVAMHQAKVDWERSYTLDFARKDESKGKMELLDHQLAYVKGEIENHTDPKDIVPMILAGFEATDDPSAAKMALRLWDKLQSEEFNGYRDYFRILIAPSNDLIQNTLMRKSKVYILNSTKEGYETVIKGALMAEKPVISTEIGGPKLQLKPITFGPDGEMIIEDRDSFLIDPRNSEQAASYLSAIHNPRDRRLYNSMQEAAARHGKEPRDTTMQAVVNYLYLMDRATSGESMPGNFAMIHDVAEAAYDEAMRQQASLPQHDTVFVSPTAQRTAAN
jgi:alpha,alpha-trehalose phosphorylase (configuration-retaining)